MDKQFKFTTDSGVFSKDGADEASVILLSCIPEISGKLLDIGCGYGLLGITLKKQYSAELTLSDINNRALSLVAKNCTQNGITADIIISDGFSDITGSFDNIVSNPPIRAGKQTVFKIYEGAFEHLNANGNLYVVIRKKHGAESTEKKLFDLFQNCETLYRKKGIFVYRCEKI